MHVLGLGRFGMLRAPPGNVRVCQGNGGGLMEGKEDVFRLIAALCDGDLNLGARSLWTVGLMKLLGEWAEEENHNPA